MSRDVGSSSSSYMKGIVYMLISGLGFAMMNTFCSLAGDVSPFQRSVFCYGGVMLWSGLMLLKSHESFYPGKKDFSLIMCRAFIGSIGTFGNFYAISYLFVADATMLSKLSPFYTLLCAAWFLKEKTTWKQYMMVIGAFLGMLLIVKPSGDMNGLGLPYLVGIIGGIGAGVAFTFVRVLGKRNVNSMLVVFWHSTVSCLLGVPFMLMNPDPLTFHQVMLLLIATVGTMLGQWGVTMAYRAAAPNKISIFDYSTVVFSAILGFIFMGQVPDGISLIGYLVIFLMSYLMFIYNRKHSEA